MCGGTTGRAVHQPPSVGLSPRVRGNPALRRTGPTPPRSIPACAGEPTAASVCRFRCRVYPRVCGGTALNILRAVRAEGLSPRVRGNRRQRRGFYGDARSIPACAGEPARNSCARPHTPVYPRVCGGTDPTPCAATAHQGLSPRVRGNPRLLWHRQSLPRSIPACAGEPFRMQNGSHNRQVYPRVCGGTRRTRPG